MRTTDTLVIIALAGAALIAGRAPAHAQPAGDPVVEGGDDRPWNRGVPVERRRAARALFLEGNRLFQVPLFARAAEKYAAALAVWKHPAFHFNLAIAQLNLDQEVEAHASLEHALRHGEEPLGPEQFREARKQLVETERNLGRIRIRCATPGAEVTLDGATLFTGPGSHEGWVRARPHEVTAKKPGFLAEARRVTVAPGQRQDLELHLITLNEASDASRRWAAWKPWSVVAAGGAIAAAGGVLHGLSSRNFSSYDAGFARLECARTGCSEAQIGAALDDRLRLADRQQTIAVAGYVAGGSLIAAGVVLLYLNRPQLREQRPPGRIAVVPAVSDTMLGVAVRVGH